MAEHPKAMIPAGFLTLELHLSSDSLADALGGELAASCPADP